MAIKFAKEHPDGSIHLILIDIMENLKERLICDLQEASGNKNIATYYNVDLQDSALIASFWETATKKHGPIGLLVNNAAICMGRKLSELSLDQFKRTMNINFISYVHLAKLFLEQPTSERTRELHLVNVSSIAGHMTC